MIFILNHFNINAYAKLNLSLDIVGKRDDGYHELTMIMQSISLHDTISLKIDNGGIIKSNSNFKYIPNDDRNLSVKAAKAFFEFAGISSGLNISTHKEIPVGSGMGGGSADAAAVIRGLNKIFECNLSKKEMETIGSKVGSDVPFCIAGGTQLATGRGEILQPLAPLPDCYFVICKPAFSISTPELYQKSDKVKLEFHPDSEGIIEALNKGELDSIACRMYNNFEDIPEPKFKEIRSIKNVLIEKGALSSIMTGSGSAVFGLFDDQSKAETAYSNLKKTYKSCFLCNNRPEEKL